MSMMLLWPPLASYEFSLFFRSKNYPTTKKKNKSTNNNLQENTHFFFMPTKILEKSTSALQSNPKSHFDHFTIVQGAS
jgi:hypothetical protein